MRLLEYQGKEIFKKAGIPVPENFLVSSPQEVDKLSKMFNLPLMVKAQVLSGKRGKAGLIQKYDDWGRIRETIKKWLGKKFGGEIIRSVLVERPINITRELYFSVTVDPIAGSPVLIACGEGGMEIEELSSDRPEAIISKRINIFRGLKLFQVRDILEQIGLEGDAARMSSQILYTLYELFCSYDAELVEINPLVIDKDGHLCAVDAKFSIDDNALFRQKGFSKRREQFAGEIEYEASQSGLNYIELDGNIGVMTAGAGYGMAVMDLINMSGAKVANFLDFGGANYRLAAKALELTMKNPNVKVIFIGVFVLVARADVIAENLVKAIKVAKPRIPIIATLRGTGENKARELIKDIGIEFFVDTEEAVRRVIQVAGEIKP